MCRSNKEHILFGQKAYLWGFGAINFRSNEAVGFGGSGREFVIIILFAVSWLLVKNRCFK